VGGRSPSTTPRFPLLFEKIPNIDQVSVMKLKLTPKLALVLFLFALGMLIGVGMQAYTRGRTALEAAAVTELESTASEKEAAIA